MIAGIIAVKTGEAGDALAEGIGAGLFAAAVVYFVLRFDARTVPAYLVTAGLLDAAENAALQGTRAGWVAFAIAAATSVAVGVTATRYISRPLPITTGS